MARVLGYPKEARRKAQNDAVLAAQAARLGCLMITRNVTDFDRLSQLEPRLRVAFYGA
jgi:predicted nucleic acid-binding protein